MENVNITNTTLKGHVALDRSSWFMKIAFVTVCYEMHIMVRKMF